ncbi:isopentenyl-diphosphate Delta-isomerase [Polluticoccus soli]|uniref:isopentenyl-diphosphate Delta-isomerase n=1 Tax=Polluticoccus soli TaxID=3034150 RepID=UPI0023E1E41F|nr:isopentenyl-diphosphate Delta-isomerase [Flavipsychrobacter sp. JY13-12]
MQRDQVITVNEQDEQVGLLDKLEAHKSGVLHRAFSIFIINKNNELLLQQRAANKYHSQNLWSNTCCSHPMPREETVAAAHRRLMEEMGFDCDLQFMFTLRYCSEVGNDLTENEMDHVYVGRHDGPVNINPEEVQNYRSISIENLLLETKEQPQRFTAWLHLALPKFIDELQKTKLS